VSFADCAESGERALGGSAAGEYPSDGEADASESVLRRTVGPNAIKRAGANAVFSNFGTKIPFAGGWERQGRAVDSTSGRETFMKMLEVQGGLGMSIKSWAHQLAQLHTGKVV
jgi:hypothetical protein